ncbi:MAG: DUF58 domain-containing protein [Treponema sp.]|nr:DUF58 domain-containing protein [Treponema sp.]
MAHILEEDRGRLVQRAMLLRLESAKIATSMRTGNFKSLYRGQGIEFSDVREYLPGDNVRAIDWNVTARMGRAFIKQYEEDKELQVFFVLDRSLSMLSGSHGRSRLNAASEACALLLLAAEQTSSATGAVFFDGEIRFALEPKVGQTQTMILLSRLDETENDVKRGSVLGAALTGAGKLLKKRSLVFVFSDFRSAQWLQPFARLAQKHDVVAVRITDPLDSELPPMGTVPFTDMESGIQRTLPTLSKAFARAWFEDNRARTDSWYNECLRHGGYPLTLSTEEDVLTVLTRFFSRRSGS